MVARSTVRSSRGHTGRSDAQAFLSAGNKGAPQWACRAHREHRWWSQLGGAVAAQRRFGELAGGEGAVAGSSGGPVTVA
jgi:hypothetical protein